MKSKTKKMTALGKYISKALVDTGMSKTALAATVGTSPQYLSYILHGQRAGLKYVPAIAMVLELDLDRVQRYLAA